MGIGIIVIIVGDLAGIFGCLIGLKDEVTAITFVALGTSLPDTFASKVAAVNEKHADNAIGNVTGSNSVNVFLGLGVPWVIATIYHAMNGSTFQVPAGALTFSVTIYIICAAIAITLILVRRFVSSLRRRQHWSRAGREQAAQICLGRHPSLSLVRLRPPLCPSDVRDHRSSILIGRVLSL